MRVGAIRWAVVAAVSVAMMLTVAGAATADTGGPAVAYQVDPAHDGYQPNPGLTLPLTEHRKATMHGALSYETRRLR